MGAQATLAQAHPLQFGEVARYGGSNESSNETSDEACDEGSDESSNETSDEGCDESQEGHEGEQDRKGQEGPGSRVSRQQGEDRQWHDQGQAGGEQEWQDCGQGGLGALQEGIRSEPAEEVDGGMQGGAKGAQHQGLRPLRRQDCPGEGAVRQDQKHPCGKMIVGAKASKPLSLVVMLQGVRAASFSGRLMKSVCVMGAPT